MIPGFLGYFCEKLLGSWILHACCYLCNAHAIKLQGKGWLPNSISTFSKTHTSCCPCMQILALFGQCIHYVSYMCKHIYIYIYTYKERGLIVLGLGGFLFCMLICWLIVLGLGGFLFCMLICWLSFVCVDARSSDCFVDRSQPSPFTQPSPYVSTTQPTNHSTIHASTPFDHNHQIPANPGTLVQPRGRHTMHLSLW